MLDGVLYHESDLDLEEHYTDTHGYTEINFAAFGMVGMRFCPRIRSLHRQRPPFWINNAERQRPIPGRGQSVISWECHAGACMVTQVIADSILVPHGGSCFLCLITQLRKRCPCGQ